MEIEKSVDFVAAHWKDSPYYADAERWTHLFWDENTIFRRLLDRMSLDTVIELAVGHGRHAEKIVSRCKKLILMDVHRENLDICRARLGKRQQVEFILSNGFNFDPVEASSISAIYCYDAMVHFSPDVVQSYLIDTRRVLAPGGHALFHHSNLDAPGSIYAQNPLARNHMPPGQFVNFCQNAGLEVLESTPIRWGRMENIDCVTLVRLT
jgi:ubiquinone/menaquinone biosynthesis C-methylase UbiE